ncbi:hypothetical protein PCI56_12240 [Plesiomonas shigelloides subsp. oncorhynchi]|nr:hypothetical protein [Plesiomonas shigelloides]
MLTALLWMHQGRIRGTSGVLPSLASALSSVWGSTGASVSRWVGALPRGNFILAVTRSAARLPQ